MQREPIGLLRTAAVLVIVFSVLGLASIGQAARLEWDASPEPDISGYRVYKGEASRVYTLLSDVGSQTNLELSVLPVGKTLYFAVTAYDTNGVESDFSEEVSYFVPDPNHTPVAANDEYSMVANLTLQAAASSGVLTNDFDPDGDALTVILVTAPDHGALILGADGAFTYTPAIQFHGLDGFIYAVTDGKKTSSVATVFINVAAPPRQTCEDCGAALSQLLQAHPEIQPSAASNCVQWSVETFSKIVRQKTALGISDSELAGVARCLAAVLGDDVAGRNETANAMFTSRWTSAATNLLGAIHFDAAYGSNLTTAARELTRCASMLRRADGLLKRGNLVPAGLTNSTTTFTLRSDGQTSRWVAEFGATEFSWHTPDGLGLQNGTYIFQQTAWNEASLLLNVGPEMNISLQLRFAGVRGRVIGTEFRGSFTRFQPLQ